MSCVRIALVAIALLLRLGLARGDDAGVPGPMDAGVLGDAATPAPRAVDAGVRRAGPRAAGPVDAGVPTDTDLIEAGVPADAGIADAGEPTDAGIDDAGVEGPDAGVDAGVIDPVEVVTPDPEPLDVGAPAQQPDIVEATAEPPPTTKTTTENTFVAIKVIAGLIVLLVLAYLGGHKRVVRFQERLGLGGVITAGFPFVALGLVAALPEVGILDDSTLRGLRPVLHFGLGWLGFLVGAQLDIRVLDRVPKGTAYLILVEALGPFALTFAGCGAVMLAFGASISDPSAWRDVTLLAAAAAMTAPRLFRGFANRAWREGRPVDVLLAQLDELVGVVALLFITAYFREPWNTSWQLPDTAWIFVSLGMGVAIGVLIFAVIRVPASNAEFLAVVLGCIAFASGLAGFLRLSPIVICFLAGVLVTNFPNDQRAPLFRILSHLERPVQLLFLIVAGAVWDVSDWRGWVLVPLFVIARIVGRWLGMLASRSVIAADAPVGYADGRMMIVPVSSLSIALVVSVESLYRTSGLPWVTTAVIGGAIATELILQRTRTPREDDEEHERRRAPIDELDDISAPVVGPIYRDDEPPPRRDP